MGVYHHTLLSLHCIFYDHFIINSKFIQKLLVTLELIMFLYFKIGHILLKYLFKIGHILLKYL
jgi:hypothetical protein